MAAATLAPPTPIHSTEQPRQKNSFRFGDTSTKSRHEKRLLKLLKSLRQWTFPLNGFVLGASADSVTLAIICLLILAEPQSTVVKVIACASVSHQISVVIAVERNLDHQIVPLENFSHWLLILPQGFVLAHGVVGRIVRRSHKSFKLWPLDKLNIADVRTPKLSRNS